MLLSHQCSKVLKTVFFIFEFIIIFHSVTLFVITQFAEWQTVLANMTKSIVIAIADWTVIACTVKHVIRATFTDVCQHEQLKLVFGSDF